MPSYRIEVSATAERQLRKLLGYDDVLRVRVGRYRILYSIEDRRLVIIVLKVGDRKDACR